jgi:hypothetical protein
MKAALVPVERIERQILLIRGQKILLDSQPSREEFADLRCHFGIPRAWRRSRYPPYAFAE